MAGELPDFLQKVIKKYPKVWKSYQDLGETISALPGIDSKTQHLVKLGIAVGSGSEGAVHSHVRRAREAGVTDEEIMHAVLLSVTTIGWPAAIAAMSWTDDILKKLAPAR